MKNIPRIDPSDEDFGTICICAIRYALGRRTYMPGLVQGYIRPMLPLFSNKTLAVMERDIADAEKLFGGYGDETIDKPGWLQFLSMIRVIQKAREAATQ